MTTENQKETTENHKEKSNTPKIILAVILLILVGGVIYGSKFYKIYFAPNISGNGAYLYIKTGSNLDSLYSEIKRKDLLNDEDAFKQAAVKMDLAQHLKPGRYRLTKKLNNRTLINMIKAGNQDPVKLKFHNIRKKEDFAGYVAKNMEADSASFLKVIDSAALDQKYGFTTDNVYTMFIPNTYDMYWNTSPVEFFTRMEKEYEKFWTAERKQKAALLNMSPQQVTILASIVDGEALYDKEMPIIAGLYLNRLNRGILLQADPTVIFCEQRLHRKTCN